MARVRSPDRDKAEKMYLKSKGTAKLKDIANELGVSEGTVRGWKNKDKWDDKLNGTFQIKDTKNTERSKRKKGGQPNNKNAVGHGAPEQNKNAVTTGEFESIFFDTLEDDEKELINAIEIDKKKLLEQEIKLLTVRERRMLQRIADLKKHDFTVVKKDTDRSIGPLGPVDKVSEIQEATLGQIQKIEESLTRIQDKKAKLISELHKWEMDHAKLELEKEMKGKGKEENKVEVLDDKELDELLEDDVDD